MTAPKTATTRGMSAYRRAISDLAAAQKSSVGAPAYSRWVNRPLGRRIAAAAFVWGRTPNQVTALSALITYTGIALLALLHPAPWVGVLATGLLVTGYAADSADGQLARLRGGGSLGGEWLDHVADCLKNSSIHLAVLVSWYRFDRPDNSALLLVPLVFSLQATVWFFALILTEKLRGKRAGGGGQSSLARSLIMVPADYGVLCLIFLFIGYHSLFVVLYSALALANVLLLSVALPKWFREVSRAGSHDDGVGR